VSQSARPALAPWTKARISWGSRIRAGLSGSVDWRNATWPPGSYPRQPVSERVRIIADRIAARGLEVNRAPRGGMPGQIAVTNPADMHHAEVIVDDEGAEWNFWGAVDENAGPHEIADQVIRLFGATDADPGDGSGSSPHAPGSAG
jgi:hypothetical protein